MRERAGKDRKGKDNHIGTSWTSVRIFYSELEGTSCDKVLGRGMTRADLSCHRVSVAAVWRKDWHTSRSRFPR